MNFNYIKLTLYYIFQFIINEKLCNTYAFFFNILTSSSSYEIYRKSKVIQGFSDIKIVSDW